MFVILEMWHLKGHLHTNVWGPEVDRRWVTGSPGHSGSVYTSRWGQAFICWTTSQLPCSSHSKLSAQRTARQWGWDGLHSASACSEDTAETRTWGCPQHSLSFSSSHLENSRARLSLQCLHFCVCEGNWVNLSLAATSSTWLWAV